MSLTFTICGCSRHHKQSYIEREKEFTLATLSFMKDKMWSPSMQLYIRAPDGTANQWATDAWGMSIVIDAYAYLVELHMLSPEALKSYSDNSIRIFKRTHNGKGAFILRQMSATGEPFIGVDDNLQCAAAYCHAYLVTNDSSYLVLAQQIFDALVDLGYWNEKPPGWCWNTRKRFPVGVSTAYGGLAAARLYKATHKDKYRKWAKESIAAMSSHFSELIPRDWMITAFASLTLYEATRDSIDLSHAKQIADHILSRLPELFKENAPGNLNPTDVGDFAEPLLALSAITGQQSYAIQAQRLVDFFNTRRNPKDVERRGYFSRYKPDGRPQLTGPPYLGVRLDVPFLPEVAEMLKLHACILKYHNLLKLQ